MKIKNALSLLALASCAALSTSVMAQNSSTVTIIGEVGADICNISVNGQNSTQLRLPKVTAGEIPTVGSTAKDTPLSIRLTDCDTSVVSQAQINFSSTGANTSGRIDTGLNGVSLQVLHNNQPIRATATAENTFQNTHARTNVTAAGTADLTYVVRYYRERLGTISGNFTTTANLSVAYL